MQHRQRAAGGDGDVEETCTCGVDSICARRSQPLNVIYKLGQPHKIRTDSHTPNKKIRTHLQNALGRRRRRRHKYTFSSTTTRRSGGHRQTQLAVRHRQQQRKRVRERQNADQTRMDATVQNVSAKMERPKERSRTLSQNGERQVTALHFEIIARENAAAIFRMAVFNGHWFNISYVVRKYFFLIF